MLDLSIARRISTAQQEREALRRDLADLQEQIFGLEFTLQAIRHFARRGDIGRIDALAKTALLRDSELRETMYQESDLARERELAP